MSSTADINERDVVQSNSVEKYNFLNNQEIKNLNYYYNKLIRI